MGNITLKVPAELHGAMRRHAEIRWSEIARRAFQSELRRLEVFERLLSNSPVRGSDVLRVGRSVRKGQTRRLERRIRALRSAGRASPPR